MKKQLLTVSIVTMALAAQAQISFTEISANTIQGVQNGSIAVADVDGDNDQDLLVTGNTGTGNLSPAVSKLYTNDGSGVYTEVMGTPFPAIFESSVGFADIDGDNDQDLLMTGYTAPGGRTKLPSYIPTMALVYLQKLPETPLAGPLPVRSCSLIWMAIMTKMYCL